MQSIFFKGFKDLYLLIPQLQLYLSNLLFIPHIIFTISSPFVSNHLSSRGGIQRFGHVRLAPPPPPPPAPPPPPGRGPPPPRGGPAGGGHPPPQHSTRPPQIPNPAWIENAPAAWWGRTGTVTPPVKTGTCLAPTSASACPSPSRPVPRH